MPPSHDFWQSKAFAEEDCGVWTIGPLSLWIQRRLGEWRLWFERSEDSHAASLVHDYPVEVKEMEKAQDVMRFASNQMGNRIVLAPSTPTRSVVSRLENPIFVLPGDETSFFVSTPLTIQVKEGSSSRVLTEIPVLRLSDTWFGPSTREGEVCFSARSKARLNLANLSHLPHRILTKVQLRNLGRDTLTLERISIPMPQVEIFENDSGGFWTQKISIEREQGGELALLRLGEGPPSEAGQSRKVFSPRTREDRGVLTRALGAFLG